jgi:hypothetical protein
MDPTRWPYAPYSPALAQQEPTDRSSRWRPRYGRMKTIVEMLISVALAFGSGCARTDWIDRTQVTVDVTGAWYGSGGQGNHSFSLLFDLEQEGSKVQGSMRVQGSGAGRSGLAISTVNATVEGTVAGDLFTFKELNGPLEGQLTVSGDEMTGLASMAQGPIRLSVRRVQSPSPPGPPPR